MLTFNFLFVRAFFSVGSVYLGNVKFYYCMPLFEKRKSKQTSNKRKKKKHTKTKELTILREGKTKVY